MRDPLRAPFPPVSADLLSSLHVDQLLQGPLGQLTDKISALPGAERVEQSGYGRLIKSHRRVLLGVHFGRYTPSITPVAHLMVDPNPTTPGDSYIGDRQTIRLHPSAPRINIWRDQVTAGMVGRRVEALDHVEIKDAVVTDSHEPETRHLRMIAPRSQPTQKGSRGTKISRAASASYRQRLLRFEASRCSHDRCGCRHDSEALLLRPFPPRSTSTSRRQHTSFTDAA